MYVPKHRFLFEYIFYSVHQGIYIIGLGIVSHKAYPDDLAFKSAQSYADLNIVLIEQAVMEHGGEEISAVLQTIP